MKKVCLLAVCMLSSFFIGFFYHNSLNEEVIPTYTEITYNSENLQSSIEKVYDATVVIETYDKNNNKIGTGSGFCYKNDTVSYFITNNHVIEDSSYVKIITINSDIYSAEILGSDDYLDIAVISSTNDACLKVVTLGDSSSLNLGDTVLAIGSPLGQKYMGTVTKGILSGKDRKVTVSNGNIMEVLQTDAAINPGNSGGPLVNLKGEVIGVTSLKLVEDEIEGMGFAIPIELVKASLTNLENGEIKRPTLGIEIRDTRSGVYINSVDENSLAFYAGLESGDYIIALDDEEVTDIANFRYLLYLHKTGDEVKITYVRNAIKYETKIVLKKAY